ncbi:lycopene cyclase family protein [Aquiflexum sp.]|uniref:lycopene cyclase family protein n=1 Tax=Aquiflexum sp. TaxID=1872584 RepID=UPI00359326A9
MITFDFVVTGLGCAGMSLMYYLLDSPLKDKKILIIDYSTKSKNDRTWCYWAENPLSIHPKSSPLVFWEKINVISGKEKVQSKLGKYKYFHIKSSDFYREIIDEIKRFSNVTFVNDHISDLKQINDGKVIVQTERNGNFYGLKVFNSIPLGQENIEGSILNQTFVGWKIRCKDYCFDESAVTLMHFPEITNKEPEFFYILPYNESEALVEFTLYTKDKAPIELLEKKLADYLKNNLGLVEFEILFKEFGTIPMTTKNFNQQNESNIIPIGTLAGCTKPSTGYTFYNIQKHCKLIVNQLMDDSAEKNFNWNRKKRLSFYDNILLNIAVNWPSELPGIFKEMFEINHGHQVLRFLNEESSLWEELKILGRLKYGIFIKSLFHYGKH